MGVIDDLALGGVDRVERTFGKRAALRALVPLLDTLPAGRGRARAILRAIDYAAEADPAQIEALCARWITDGEHAPDARRAIVRLAGAGHHRAASQLAESEVLRTVGRYEEGAARYALGRCLEREGRLEDALLEHVTAEHLASEQPRLRAQSGVRAMRVLARLGRRAEAAARASALLPLERGEPEDRLAVAVIALDCPGRYRRAAALDVLEGLAASGGEVGEAARRWAAWHAERAGGSLSEIEADRIEAIVLPAGEQAVRRVRALAAIAARAPSGAHAADPVSAEILPRARAVLEGSAPGPRPSGDRAIVGWLGLAICAAVARRDRLEAREHLREATERVRAGARLEAPVWTAAVLALRDAHLREAGGALASALLAREGEAPPRGFLALADALSIAGHELATDALRRAAARREPGARERLMSQVRHRAWRAADAGDRTTALTLLREARRLAGADGS